MVGSSWINVTGNLEESMFKRLMIWALKLLVRLMQTKAFQWVWQYLLLGMGFIAFYPIAPLYMALGAGALVGYFIYRRQGAQKTQQFKINILDFGVLLIPSLIAGAKFTLWYNVYHRTPDPATILLFPLIGLGAALAVFVPLYFVFPKLLRL